jgi:plastocyanin
MTGNGLFTDASGPTATKAFAHSGEQIVRLRATDDRGVSTIIAGTVSVGGPPIAAFNFSPTSPTVGRTVTFTSSSRDIDGAVVAQAWDLNGDGQFSDASGPTAQYAYPAAGNYTVALRVTDNSGLTATAFQTVTVGAAAAPGASTARSQSPARALQALFPFPIVRIAGRLTSSGARIVLLEVHAPRGARVLVRCRGGGCPRRDLVATVRGSRPLHFSRMRRSLRAGAIVQVFVRGTGRIGKYTRFAIRRGRAPARRDMCLVPGATKPSSCRAT